MDTMDKFVRPELLAPAGNLEKCLTALLYGATAVYLGGQTFNLRAGCDGFSSDDLGKAVAAANKRGAKVYYTLNALPMQKDLGSLPGTIEEAAAAGVHGMIVADAGVLRLVQQYAPGMEIHLSTQANTTNAASVAFWAEQGVSRVNLARELSCRDIYAVRKAVPAVDLEIFVHGAMCLAVSGHCLLSAWLNNRPANLGRCTHPCRFEYSPLNAGGAFACSSGEESMEGLTVAEKTRPGQPLWTVYQQADYASFWAPLDLCLIRYLPWFIRAGVASLKVEGRMKGASYVAHVLDAYSTALDVAMRAVSERGNLFDATRYMPELLYTASRPLGSGFFLPGARRNFTEEFLAASEFSPKALVARVREPIDVARGAWAVDVRGSWQDSAAVELMLPGMDRPVLAAGAYALENHRGERVRKVGSGIQAVMYTDSPKMAEGIFIRLA